MIRDSNEMITYTGAGISVAAGIDDYATKVKDVSITAAEMPRVKDWKDARPTLTHRVLTGMYEAGYLKHWIQQNHDSLPQKAGYPQSCLNGTWLHHALRKFRSHHSRPPTLPATASPALQRSMVRCTTLVIRWCHTRGLYEMTYMRGYTTGRR